ncbi:LysR substrate-binding domain-containing protein [Kushneria phyllosphaerae]|uniref:HTH-type transcriptional regulator BenM n=1 Tax=Kushneria phyllosphaerae TaxID=2100822 RepID=A0A2R8CLK7_9GAMM|nr:LysR substrate-binding domain-containing protein [Kushneria phyllosphaerae]SPJ33776.1 HTH-type transcriptional regulator BenM [Kushneria phyllosphaerae]
MELRHLRYFLAVAEELHFARAASRLSIVQPALSMQIKALEARLNAQLFVRNRRQVRLTASGQALLPEARRILAQVVQAEEIVRQTEAGVLGRVRVGYAASALYAGVLGRAVHTLQKAYPNIELQVSELHPHSQHTALREGRLDATFGPMVSLTPDTEFEHRRLAEFALRVALPAEHPLADNALITASDLRQESFIGYIGEHDDEGSYLMTRALGYRPRIGMQAQSPVIALGLVEAGLGVTLVSSVLAPRFSQGVVYRELVDVDLALDVTLIMRIDEHNPAVMAFRRVLNDITFQDQM